MAISNNSTGLRPGVCTSTTRPTAPYEGQHIYETDTDIEYVWSGTAWVVNYVSAASPAFTGTPTAPTASAGTNTTQLATTAFVMGAFRILQVVTGTTNTQTSTGSGTFSDAGLSATITPKSASNKVLVFAQINWYNADTNKITFSLVRGSTKINETNPLGGDSNNLDGGHFLTLLDSPATTSATTYKVQFRVSGGAGYLRASSVATCTIYLIEVNA